MLLFYVLSFFKKGDTIQGETLFKGGGGLLFKEIRYSLFMYIHTGSFACYNFFVHYFATEREQLLTLIFLMQVVLTCQNTTFVLCILAFTSVQIPSPILGSFRWYGILLFVFKISAIILNILILRVVFSWVKQIKNSNFCKCIALFLYKLKSLLTLK